MLSMKISHNKVLFTFLLVFIIASESFSQSYNRGTHGGRSDFSLELGAGIPIPFSPSNDLKFGDAKKGELGLRYLPDGNKLGVRGYYGYASLSDSDAELSSHSNKLIIHRIELQGIYMLHELLGVPYGSIFELESYLGIGAAIGNPSSSDATNKMLTSTIGLRPRFLIDNNQFHVYLDVSYGMLLNQKFDYAGEFIPSAKTRNLGSMAQITIGFSYRL